MYQREGFAVLARPLSASEHSQKNSSSFPAISVCPPVGLDEEFEYKMLRPDLIPCFATSSRRGFEAAKSCEEFAESNATEAPKGKKCPPVESMLSSSLTLLNFRGHQTQLMQMNRLTLRSLALPRNILASCVVQLLDGAQFCPFSFHAHFSSKHSCKLSDCTGLHDTDCGGCMVA